MDELTGVAAILRFPMPNLEDDSNDESDYESSGDDNDKDDTGKDKEKDQA